MNRGFLATVAIMIFSFSLVTAALSVLLSQPDLSESARIGPIVESARWAVEADLYKCGNMQFDGTIFKETVTGDDQPIAVSGSTSIINGQDTGFLNVSVKLVRDYPPAVQARLDGGVLAITACDPENTPMSYTVYKGVDPIASGVIEQNGEITVEAGAATLYVVVQDETGHIVISPLVGSSPLKY